MIFVNSMSDLFHKDVPTGFIDKVFDTMEAADHHVYQVLAKRSSLMRSYLRRRYGKAGAPAHIWCGVSVEDLAATSRIRHLQARSRGAGLPVPGAVAGGVGPLDLSGISRVIVGGESGPGARPMTERWVLDVRDQCARAGVAFFFKQWGGARPTRG